MSDNKKTWDRLCLDAWMERQEKWKKERGLLLAIKDAVEKDRDLVRLTIPLGRALDAYDEAVK